MNFNDAITAHSAWKRRLTAYLQKPDKSIDPVQLAKDDQCELGQWIHAELSKHASDPRYSELKKEHANFHRAAADVVRRANAGQAVSAETVLGAKSEYGNCSSRVVQAIMQMMQVPAK